MQNLDKQTTRKLSLRDPAGSLYDVDGRLIRVVNSAGLPHLNATLESPTFVSLQQSNKLAGTRVLLPDEAKPMLTRLEGQGVDLESVGKLLEHDRVHFTSFPYEWSPQMLHAAAELTLDLATKLLPEGMGIKDATPYNILFDGSTPVFVDVLSFEKRIRGDATWAPFAQFTRTFLNPLLLNRFFGIPISMSLLSRREGVDAAEVYDMCGWWQRFRQPYFSLATVPYFLDKLARRAKKSGKAEAEPLKPEKARFILNSLFSHLKRLMKDVEPVPQRRSRWISYMKEELPYSKQQFFQKEEWIDQQLKELRPRKVLDVGCNTGHFSRLCTKYGAKVVGVDTDPAVIDESWRVARQKKLDILPLVINLASPSPAVGWQNNETQSFLQRASGNFDMVMMLAVLHHLTVGEGLPLTEVLSLASQLTNRHIILEFIGPEDVSVRDLVQARRPKEVVTEEVFEMKARHYFDIEKQYRIHGSSRVLYLLRKKSGTQSQHSN